MKSAHKLLTQQEFIKLLKRKRGDRSLREFSKELGVAFQYLGHVFSGVYQPGPAIAEALGFEQITCYRKGKGKGKHKAPKTKHGKPVDKKQMRIEQDARLAPVNVK